MLKLILLGIVILFCSCNSERVRYDNYALYKILPANSNQIKILQELHKSDTEFDFWSDPTEYSDFVSVLSKPSSKNDLEAFLQKNDINFEIANPNIQDAIDKERIESISRSANALMSWDAYYNLEQIYSWLDSLLKAYPNIVTSLNAGTSYEGRPIRGIKLSRGAGRRVIFLEGGIHSREWISPSTVCYIANELILAENNKTMAAANDYDWYIFPVVNPDGYVYSFDVNRMWRKNRRPIRGNTYGVDLNRNFNNNWMVVGASFNPQSEIYAGSGPFSEPETRALSTFIRSIGDEIDMYLSFHSFSQFLMLPFGNTTTPLANYNDAMVIGNASIAALSVRYGTIYHVGNIAEIIYEATGGSVDWVKEELKVPLVYTYELRDAGTNGFLLPTDQILPNNEETMDSLLEIIRQGKIIGYLQPNSGIMQRPSFATLFVALIAFMLKYRTK